MAPGLRVTLLRSTDAKIELFGRLDAGFGHTFGDSGPGWDATLGLPPGSNVGGGDNLSVFGAVGPGIRYWPHPQLALVSSVLARGDYVTTSSTPQFKYNQFSFDIMVGLGILALL